MLQITKSIVKEVKKLHSRKYREEMQLFISEGFRHLEGAEQVSPVDETFGIVGKAKNIKYLVVCDEFSGEIPDLGCSVYRADEATFRKISTVETPQGIMAICEIPKVAEFIDENDNSLVLLFDRIQNPGNLGTIIRTAECAGVSAIILSKESVDLYNPKVVRSTMGAIFRVPILINVDLVDFIKKSGRKTIAMALGESSKNFYNIDMTGRISIIIGNEANGISQDVLEVSDYLAEIPMAAGESLNAAIASGIACFEWRRVNIEN